MKVLLSEEAAGELLTITRRLGSSRLGQRLVEQFENALDRLAMFPRSGIAHERLGENGRYVVLGEFMLLYEIREDSIWITALVDSAVWRHEGSQE